MSTKKDDSVKSTHAKGTAFPVVVCDAIRHHVGEMQVLESERTAAFDRRDAASEAKRGLKDPDSKEYLRACREHSDAVIEIDSLDLAIKFHRAEITRCVKKADDPQLELKLEPPDPESEQLPLNPDDKPKKKRAGDEPIDPSKPVGRVPKTQDPLDRPLGDLDVRQDIRSKLAKTSLKTVRELARTLDAGKDLEDELNLPQSDMVAVKRAVQAMRDAAEKK